MTKKRLYYIYVAKFKQKKSPGAGIPNLTLPNTPLRPPPVKIKTKSLHGNCIISAIFTGEKIQNNILVKKSKKFITTIEFYFKKTAK